VRYEQLEDVTEILVVDTAIDEVQMTEVHGLQLAKHGADTGLVVGRLADGEGLVPNGLPTALQVGVGDHSAQAELYMFSA
jgi:hypothetical protein